MTRGKITNKQTGLEITGDLQDDSTLNWISFKIEGTKKHNAFHKTEWDFTPEPEQIKEGVYSQRREGLGAFALLTYRNGKWRDAFGYALAQQNWDVSRLVRLVPEA